MIVYIFNYNCSNELFVCFRPILFAASRHFRNRACALVCFCCDSSAPGVIIIPNPTPADTLHPKNTWKCALQSWNKGKTINTSTERVVHGPRSIKYYTPTYAPPGVSISGPKPGIAMFFPNCFRPDGKAYALATVGNTRRGNNNPGQKRIIIISKPLTSCSLLGCQPLFHHAGAFRVITSARPAQPALPPHTVDCGWIGYGLDSALPGSAGKTINP